MFCTYRSSWKEMYSSWWLTKYSISRSTHRETVCGLTPMHFATLAVVSPVAKYLNAVHTYTWKYMEIERALQCFIPISSPNTDTLRLVDDGSGASNFCNRICHSACLHARDSRQSAGRQKSHFPPVIHSFHSHGGGGGGRLFVDLQFCNPQFISVSCHMLEARGNDTCRWMSTWCHRH